MMDCQYKNRVAVVTNHIYSMFSLHTENKNSVSTMISPKNCRTAIFMMISLSLSKLNIKYSPKRNIICNIFKDVQ